MPPKGILRPPSQLGFTIEHGRMYRLQLSAMRELGMSAPTNGPARATKAAAEGDLAQARTCASRRDMLDFVLALPKKHLFAVQADGLAQSGEQLQQLQNGYAKKTTPISPSTATFHNLLLLESTRL